jgi:hypothetical protein
VVGGGGRVKTRVLYFECCANDCVLGRALLKMIDIVRSCERSEQTSRPTLARNLENHRLIAVMEINTYLD